MAERPVTRRLTTIVAADVASYSRLMGADEEGTLAELRAHRNELIDPKIAEYGGRIVNTAGDSILIEFPSVIEALRCTIDVQSAMAERNRDTPEDRRIVFRVGINVGDVMEQDGDLLGDGVNIAARLEGLAEPGGICLSRTVRDQVRDRMEIALEDMGEVEVKNIARPVRAFRVLTEPGTFAEAARRAKPAQWLKRGVAVGVVVLILAGAGALAWLQPWQSGTARLTSSLSAKTSIAVLPFSNLSRDPEQEYFSDGITNDLITDLSKFHDLFVIASNSVFTYKGKAVKVQDVGRELGVKYVLEGSVQRHGERIRINAQLIDASAGQHLWADRYDEAVTDLFDLQDRITKRIVRTLAIKLTEIEQERAFSKPTRNLEAYDYLLQGRALIKRSMRKENFQARELFRQTIELDPGYASAYAGLGWTYIYPLLYGWTGQPQEALNRAQHFAQQALLLSESNVDGHKLLSRVYITRQQYDLALIEAERVIATNPNDAEGHIEQGNVLLWSGRIDGAILALKTASRFDPNMNPEAFWYLAVAYYLKQEYADAVTVLKRNVGRRLDNVFDYAVLAGSYAQLERPDEARRATETVRRLDPFFAVDDFGSLFSNPTHAAHLIDGLRKAGL